MIEHKSIKAYIQHGFIPTGENESQIYGMCPFCGREDDCFYVSKETKAWDCKSCDKSGGFKTFLKETIAICKSKFFGNTAIQLSKERDINLNLLKSLDVGYNVITDNYCFPVKFGDGKLVDLKIYAEIKAQKRLISTFSCNPTLYGLTKDFYDTIYLCEGEWDRMIMTEIIQKLKLDKTIALGVPGANTFKLEWSGYFKNKNVIVLYDKDKAGDRGSIKVYNTICSIVKSIKFVHWGKDCKKGYDVTNLYTSLSKNHTKTYKVIQKLLEDLPTNFDEKEAEKVKSQKQNEYIVVPPREHDFKFESVGLSVKEVYEGYRKYLHIPDNILNVIDFVYGTIIANRLTGIPVWSFLVASSGHLKTTLISSLSDVEDVHEEDNMSVAGLVSGFAMGGKKGGEIDTSIDHSLLPELNKKILCIQDLTSLLSDRQENKAKIFGMLRSMFDGKYKHRFGNIRRIYNSTFGLLAGVTPDGIKILDDEDRSLGERFISYEIKIPEDTNEEIEYIRRAMSNTSKEDMIKSELKSLSDQCLNYDFVKNLLSSGDGNEIEISLEIQEKIIYLSLFVSIMRGKVDSDKYTKDIISLGQREISTRLSKQLLKLLKGICLFHRKLKITNKMYEIIKNVAVSSIPENRLNITKSCYKNSINGIYTAKVLTTFKDVKLSGNVCELIVKKLTMLNVFKTKKGKNYSEIEFLFTEKFIDIMNRSEVYKTVKN